MRQRPHSTWKQAGRRRPPSGWRGAWHRLLTLPKADPEEGFAARAMHLFAVGGMPALMALLTLASVVFWQDRYTPDHDPHSAEFRVLESEPGESPRHMVDLLEDTAPVPYADTRLSTRPFWMLIDLKGVKHHTTTVVFPSRHALKMTCWDALSLREPLARAGRSTGDGPLRVANSGFALDLAATHGVSSLLCEGQFEGPARIRVETWDSAEFATSVAAFHRSSGLLEGGTLVLAAFVFLVALVNREWIYVIFAGWLVANFHVAAISAGFDWTWLGRAVPDWLILPMRKAGIAAYCLLTVGLFARLFSADLQHIRDRWILIPVQWSGLALLVAAFLPFSIFLPIMWSSVAFGVAVIAYLLIRILRKSRSPVAMWYGASLTVTLMAGLYEVLAAAFGLKMLVGAINSVTAALASSLLAALAIAAQFRLERDKRVAAEAESMRASSKLEAAYTAIPIGLFTADESGRLVQTNPAFRTIVGLGREAARHATWSELFPAHDWKQVLEVTRHSARELEVRRSALNNEVRWFVVQATRSGDLVEGSLQDVTERKTATDRLRFLADHDPLTGILNRRGIEVNFTRLSHRRTPRPAALGYLDLDRFKLINDLYGHPAGDEVLRQVCERIKAHLTDSESFARVGGDEFVILFHDAPIARAHAICTALVQAIEEQPFRIGEKAFQVKGSFGLIELDREIPFRDAIATADRACREAKVSQNGHVVTYENGSELFRERIAELRLIERIGQGLEDDSLFLEMQPIMSLERPFESLNFEVLLRMRGRDNKVILPSKIITAADNNARMAIIDRWVLERTLIWIEQNRPRFNATQFVCVNLSGSSLNDERFIADAFSMLSAHPLAASLLCLEITESVALHDLQNTGRFINRAKSLGAKIALDDFGAGYSSFSYLRDLPADALKIDGGFIQGASSHPANVAILQAIIELTHNLGMKSIAEWVEDLETLRLLAELGADYVQGFAIAPSQPQDVILAAKSSAEFILDPDIHCFVQERKSIRRSPAPIRLLKGGRVASAA